MYVGSWSWKKYLRGRLVGAKLLRIGGAVAWRAMMGTAMDTVGGYGTCHKAVEEGPL